VAVKIKPCANKDIALHLRNISLECICSYDCRTADHESARSFNATFLKAVSFVTGHSKP